MRIIGGSAGGRKLHTPKGQRVRPTADRVKEALFSILASRLGDLTGLRVLDICAGTGSLGIEALSRGAAEAVFVDNHRESLALIRANLALAGFAGSGRVLAGDAVASLRRLEQLGERFDLILLDPPYGTGVAAAVLEILGESALTGPGSIVAAEVSIRESLSPAFGRLIQVDRRVYGDTVIALYAMHEEGR